MKKLNNKGFTLVELLAVIIILAIVVGISIPAITNVINDSKNNALGVAVNAAEDYLRDQYALMQLGSASEAFKKNISGPINPFSIDTRTANGNMIELLNAMGFSKKDILGLAFSIKDNGEVCVRVQALRPESQFYSTKYWQAAGGPKPGSGVKNQSKGCS